MGLKVAWDIDGTLYFNVLELDFFGCVDRWGGREKVLPFNQTNPQVRLEEVKNVLTFRPEWMRKMTLLELVNHGICSDVNLIMNPSERDDRPHESARFKADTLNEREFDVYVDNDDVLRRNMQPYTTAKCVSVEEYYYAGAQDIRMLI
jgi:hypothetical protein